MEISFVMFHSTGFHQGFHANHISPLIACKPTVTFAKGKKRISWKEGMDHGWRRSKDRSAPSMVARSCENPTDEKHDEPVSHIIRRKRCDLFVIVWFPEHDSRGQRESAQLDHFRHSGTSRGLLRGKYFRSPEIVNRPIRGIPTPMCAKLDEITVTWNFEEIVLRDFERAKSDVD